MFIIELYLILNLSDIRPMMLPNIRLNSNIRYNPSFTIIFFTGSISCTIFSSFADPFHFDTDADPFRGITDPDPALDPT